MSTSIIWRADLAATLGGALFAVSAIVISSMPRGGIGCDRVARPMWETGAADALLML